MITSRQERPFLRGQSLYRPTPFDLLAFLFVFGMAVMIVGVLRQTASPIAGVERPLTDLAPGLLPIYALRTTLRMLAALAVSFGFTLGYATLAAKSRRAEMILIPILDILQSVPVLGFISFTVTFFLALFPGREFGAELACIFAIFTGQAWNMTLSLYQSLKTIPASLDEVASGFHLSAWQRFTQLELPFATPALVWNMMMSMSGGWFFIVAAEAIKVGDLQISLPGIGSYLAAAIEQRNLAAIGWTILAMGIVILAYDQLLFRPLVAWADKFRYDTATGGAEIPSSWFLDLLRRGRVLRLLILPLRTVMRRPLRFPIGKKITPHPAVSRGMDYLWYAAIAIGLFICLQALYRFISTGLTLADITSVAAMGLVTLLRVIAVVFLSSVIWVPVGIYIGLRPNLARAVQPVAQFLAAFPANLFFPIAVIVILRFHLNANIWLTLLLMLGTQWYVLFNVVAGASVFPHDLRESMRNFHVTGWLRFCRITLPGIMPYYLTGALTAAGNAWNTTIVAEAVSWGDSKITAYGVGSYIAAMTDKGDFPRIVLGIAVMSAYVLLCNSLVWRPLLRWSKRRFRLG